MILISLGRQSVSSSFEQESVVVCPSNRFDGASVYVPTCVHTYIHVCVHVRTYTSTYHGETQPSNYGSRESVRTVDWMIFFYEEGKYLRDGSKMDDIARIFMEIFCPLLSQRKFFSAQEIRSLELPLFNVPSLWSRGRKK